MLEEKAVKCSYSLISGNILNIYDDFVDNIKSTNIVKTGRQI